MRRTRRRSRCEFKKARRMRSTCDRPAILRFDRSSRRCRKRTRRPAAISTTALSPWVAPTFGRMDVCHRTQHSTAECRCGASRERRLRLASRASAHRQSAGQSRRKSSRTFGQKSVLPAMHLRRCRRRIRAEMGFRHPDLRWAVLRIRRASRRVHRVSACRLVSRPNPPLELRVSAAL